MSRPVRVEHLRLSSQFRLPDRLATETLKAVAPVRAREYDEAARRWVVFASAVPAVLAALRQAGYEVAEDGSS